MKPLVFFMIILLSGTASAGLGDAVDAAKDQAVSAYLDDLLSQKCWDGDWAVTDKMGTPVRATKTNRHIRAWIDIVGFKNEAILNGTHCVNGSAEDFAIVKRNAWHTPINGEVMSFKSVYSILDHAGDTTAKQTTYLRWRYWKDTLFGGKWVYIHEGPLTVSCTVPRPERFTRRLQNVIVKIQVHNRSVNPITYLSIPAMDNLTLVRATYNGSTITRHDQLGRVIKNDRGTELVEFTRDNLPTWTKDKNQLVIDHRGREITIFGDDFNLSLLDVVLVSPYETRTVTDYEIVEVDDHIKVPVSLLKVVAFGVIGAALIYLTLGVLIRAL